MVESVTISKKEYQKLLEKAFKYEYLSQILKEKKDIFASPPTRKIKEIIKSFRETKLYSPQFLKSLEKGLKRSSYFQK
ncbi:MAG: hypothetical protein QME57_01840 [Patescibacteria group bacterium]|nr:hypothetical protein [Patescibacteria group bacterium]